MSKNNAISSAKDARDTRSVGNAGEAMSARSAKGAARESVRILFVCHGNICRSPMAEFVMKDMVAKRGIAERFEIASAATSTEELGNPVHHGTQRRLAREGISCAGKTARQLRANDYEEYDLLIGMDAANIRNMRRKYANDPQAKIYLLLEFAGEHRDIADPWYTGNFDETYEDVCDGCAGLLSWLGF